MISNKEKLMMAVEYSKEILARLGPMAAIVLCERLKRDCGLHNVSAKELSIAIRLNPQIGIKRRSVISEREFENACDGRGTLIYYVGEVETCPRRAV